MQIYYFIRLLYSVIRAVMSCRVYTVHGQRCILGIEIMRVHLRFLSMHAKGQGRLRKRARRRRKLRELQVYMQILSVGLSMWIYSKTLATTTKLEKLMRE
jgi:hypothetical protein